MQKVCASACRFQEVTRGQKSILRYLLFEWNILCTALAQNYIKQFKMHTCSLGSRAIESSHSHSILWYYRQSAFTTVTTSPQPPKDQPSRAFPLPCRLRPYEQRDGSACHAKPRIGRCVNVATVLVWVGWMLIPSWRVLGHGWLEECICLNLCFFFLWFSWPVCHF